MRAQVPKYDLVVAHSLGDCFERLAQGYRPLAGGTDVMVVYNAGRQSQERFVSLHRLSALKGIEVEDDQVHLGALTTYAEILAHPVLVSEFPCLVEAASLTGAVAIQNRGTLGGNIVNASPAADSPPALIAYEADLELVSPRGRRRIAYETFHRGYKQMDLASDELVAAVHLPRRPAGIHYYRKVGTRKAQAISKVALAGFGRLEQGRLTHLRLALASVAPTVVACPALRSQLEGLSVGELQALSTAQIGEWLAQDIAPIDDIRSTAGYRARVSANLVHDFCRALSQGG